MAMLASMPDTDDVRALHDSCVALVKRAGATPTSVERDALMRDVLAVHVSITRLRRRSRPPK